MRKILVSTILGVGIAGTANASIVSSGFLDEKLTEMTNATTLQLDNKANQSDLTELSNIVAKSGWNTENGSLEFSSFPFTNEFGFESTGSWVKATRGIVDMLGQYNANIMFPGLAGVTYKLLNGWTDAKGGTTYLGVKDLNTKIGTLPSGNFPEFPYSDFLFPELNQPFTYPTSLAELITAIYGNSETDSKGLLSAIITGIPADADGDGQYESNAGLMPNLELATTASDIARANATKINANTAKIGTVPDGKNLAGMISETDAKIGTLPAGYDSVGAALTAIKGIAEDAKAAALAAIPDPKQEGSSGKFVLTVDIVGDNATYRWEKIDREGETTTTE